jgi:hypothetical protein
MSNKYAPAYLKDRDPRSCGRGAALVNPDLAYTKAKLEKLGDNAAYRQAYESIIRENTRPTRKGEPHRCEPWLGDEFDHGPKVSVRKFRLLNAEKLRLIRRSEKGVVDWFLAIHTGQANGFNYFFLTDVPPPPTVAAVATPPPTTTLPVINTDDDEAEEYFLQSQQTRTSSASVHPISGPSPLTIVLPVSGDGEDWEAL